MLKKRKEVRKTSHHQPAVDNYCTIPVLSSICFHILVNSFDWVYWMCCTWSSNSCDVLLTHQTRCHVRNISLLSVY